MVWKAALASLVVLAPAVSNDAVFDKILANGLAASNDRFAAVAPIEPFPSLTIIAPIIDGQTNKQQADGAGFYTYEGGILTLVYNPSTQSNAMETSYPAPIRRWLETVAYSRIAPAGKFKASNAFGAQTTVAKYNMRTVKLAYDPVPQLRLADVRLSLSGPEAQKLALVAAVRLTLEASAIEGEPKCQHLLVSGTINRPVEVDDLTCTVRVKLAKVEFIRQDTGEVLR